MSRAEALNNLTKAAAIGGAGRYFQKLYFEYLKIYPEALNLLEFTPTYVLIDGNYGVKLRFVIELSRYEFKFNLCPSKVGGIEGVYIYPPRGSWETTLDAMEGFQFMPPFPPRNVEDAVKTFMPPAEATQVINDFREAAKEGPMTNVQRALHNMRQGNNPKPPRPMFAKRKRVENTYINNYQIGYYSVKETIYPKTTGVVDGHIEVWYAGAALGKVLDFFRKPTDEFTKLHNDIREAMARGEYAALEGLFGFKEIPMPTPPLKLPPIEEH